MDLMNYIQLFEDGSTEATLHKPSYGLYEKTSADDNREVYIDGKWYDTTGGELVTNGTFDTDGDTNGWTAYSSGTNFTVSGGQLVTVDDCVQYITLEVGQEYSIKGSYSSGTQLRLYDSTVVTTILYITDEFQTFVATETTASIYCFATSSYDNISVYKLEPTLAVTPNLPHSYLSQNGKLLGVEVADGVPVDLHYDELAPTLVEDTIKVSNLVVGDRVIFEDRPVFTGYAGGTNITSAGVIFDWAVELDTHNAYNNGIWTCPKAGWYKFNPRVRNAHTNTTSAIVNSEMYINGVLEVRFYSDGTSYQKFIAVEPTIMKYLEVGATMYIESMTASSTHYISFINGKVLTNIVITYEGA